MTADSPKESAQRPLDAGEAENPHPTGSSGLSLTSGRENSTSVDFGISGIAAQNTGAKPALGAPPMTFAEAEVYYERLVSWRTVPSPADQALYAYKAEVCRLEDVLALARLHHAELVGDNERLRVIEAAAREGYEALKLAGAQYTPQGTRLAEVLKIKHELQAQEEPDGA